jgi:hypothetical protein
MRTEEFIAKQKKAVKSARRKLEKAISKLDQNGKTVDHDALQTLDVITALDEKGIWDKDDLDVSFGIVTNASWLCFKYLPDTHEAH